MDLKKQFGGTWSLLTRAPLTIWLGMSVVDTVTGSPAKEAAAFDVAVGEAKARYGHSRLITAVLAEAHEPGGAQRSGLSAANREELLARLGRIAQALDTKASAPDAREFKEFLMAFGRRIARASSESLVGSRLKVSQPEEEFLHDAGRALGIYG